MMVCQNPSKTATQKALCFPSNQRSELWRQYLPLLKLVDRQNNHRKMIVHCSLFSSFFLHLLGSNTPGGSKQWSHWCHQQRHSGERSWCDSEWVIITKFYVFLPCFTRFFRSCARMRLTFARFGNDVFFWFDQWLKMWQLTVGFKTVIWLQAIEMS